MSTVRRALYAMEAMAGLVMETVMAVLSGGEERAPTGVKISSDFPWGEVLKEVEVAIFDRLRAGFPGEVEVVEAAVRVVVGVIDGEDDGEKASRLGSTVEELEGKMEELTEGLDPVAAEIRIPIRALSIFKAGFLLGRPAKQSLYEGRWGRPSVEDHPTLKSVEIDNQQMRGEGSR